MKAAVATLHAVVKPIVEIVFKIVIIINLFLVKIYIIQLYDEYITNILNIKKN